MKFSQLDLPAITNIFRIIIQEYGVAEYLEKDSESISFALVDHLIDLKKGRATYPELNLNQNNNSTKINEQLEHEKNEKKDIVGNTGQICIANGESQITANMNVIN